MRSLGADFRFVGDDEELAVIAEDGDKKFIAIVERPQVTEVTYEHLGDIEISAMNGETFKARSSPPRVTMEVTGVLKEEIVGENAEQHIPDIVDDMSVEQLLCAVNKKLEDRD